MADKVQMPYTDHFAEVMKIMSTRGVLLATWKEPGKVANAMTIGWGMIGSVWSRPIWQVVVRPSRFTYTLLETERFFSVNVLPKSLNRALTLCGTASGRDRDKLADAGLTVEVGAAVGNGDAKNARMLRIERLGLDSSLGQSTRADQPSHGRVAAAVHPLFRFALREKVDVFRQTHGRGPRFGRIDLAAGPIDADVALGQSFELLDEKQRPAGTGPPTVEQIAGEHDEIDVLGQCRVEDSLGGSERGREE